MKTLLADIHMHTLASGHAYGTIREMATAARDRGLALIGVSEHAPGIPGTVDPFYYRNLKAVPRLLSGVEVIHGSEINVLAGGEALPGPGAHRPAGLRHRGHPHPLL